MQDEVFDEDFLKFLSVLRLLARKRSGSAPAGDHAAPVRGGYREFADHRPYAPGDDLRAVDWHLYARLEQLFVKEFAREVDLEATLIVDASGSMALCEAPKRRFTLRLAAGLCTVALYSDCRLLVHAAARAADRSSPPFRGEEALSSTLRFLGEIPFQGETELPLSLKRLHEAGRLRGTLLLVSDLLSPLELQQPLASLAERQRQVAVFHVLTPSELLPDIQGKATIVDAETGASRELFLGAAQLQQYRRRVKEFRERWDRFCRRYGMEFFPLSADQSLEEFFLGALREKRIVR